PGVGVRGPGRGGGLEGQRRGGGGRVGGAGAAARGGQRQQRGQASRENRGDPGPPRSAPRGYNRRVAAAIVSALHLLALAIGLPSVYLRGRALRGQLDADGIRRVLAADSVWGIAALLWVVTGLLRAFGGLHKCGAFYLPSALF